MGVYMHVCYERAHTRACIHVCEACACTCMHTVYTCTHVRSVGYHARTCLNYLHYNLSKLINYLFVTKATSVARNTRTYILYLLIVGHRARVTIPHVKNCPDGHNGN